MSRYDSSVSIHRLPVESNLASKGLQLDGTNNNKKVEEKEETSMLVYDTKIKSELFQIFSLKTLASDRSDL